MSLLALPSELIETVLVSSRSPRTVANLAQTCRALYTLVYASPDSHLWRELFLTTWDDSRPALDHRALIDPRVRPDAWEWGTEYRRRVAADRSLKAWRRDVCLVESNTVVPSDSEIDAESAAGNALTNTRDETTDMADADTDPAWYTTTLSALSAVLSTLLTFSPFPTTPPITLTVLTPPHSHLHPPARTYRTGTQIQSNAADQRERERDIMTSAPPLPPLLIVLVGGSGFSGSKASASAVRVGRMVYGPHVSRALTWARTPTPTPGPISTSTSTAPIEIPIPSLPPQLVRTLLASHLVGVRKLPAHVPSLSGADECGGDALTDVFHRIVCITGFVPIPPPLVSASTSSLESATHNCMPSTSADVHASSKDAATEEVAEDDVGTVTVEDGEQEQYCEHCGESHRGSELDHQRTGGNPKVFPTPSQQYADARTLARRRVYNMRYLRGDRLWGPYQPVTRASLGARSGTNGGWPDGDRVPKPNREEGHAGPSGPASRRGGTDHLRTLAWAMGMDVDPEANDSTSEESEDDEWRDPADTGRTSSVAPASRDTADADLGMDTEMEPEEPEHPFVSLILASTEPPAHSASSTESRRTRRSNPRLPPNNLVSPREIRPQHLRPDYVYLASVRIVVEANLKDLFGRETSDDAQRFVPENRPDGVGMFWEDEDEVLLHAQDGSVGPAPSFLHTSSSIATTAIATTTGARTTTTVTTTPSSDASSATFDLMDILSRFRNLEVVRLGSACGYWDAWIGREEQEMRSVDETTHRPASASSQGGDIKPRRPRIVVRRAELEKPTRGAPTIGDKGKGKGKVEDGDGAGLGDWEVGLEGEACSGWDWAGVSGIWRRCVCWMDYRELLFFNLDPSKFLTLDTQEACRIIPMRLRITGYTRAGLMPVHDVDIDIERGAINVLGTTRPRSRQSPEGYFRPPPVIHFAGSSIGSDRSLEDGRAVRGCVELIGGGEVRWQMDTYPQGSESLSTAEWSSEAVQIGGIGSVVGLLGMWTGTGHERADPLGPFWAWKVA